MKRYTKNKKKNEKKKTRYTKNKKKKEKKIEKIYQYKKIEKKKKLKRYTLCTFEVGLFCQKRKLNFRIEN